MLSPSEYSTLMSSRPIVTTQTVNHISDLAISSSTLRLRDRPHVADRETLDAALAFAEEVVLREVELVGEVTCGYRSKRDIEFFTEIKTYFFTTDMDFWRIVFKPEIPWRELAYGASRCGVYIFVFLLASALLFERKEITT